jgi:hypothetical protein
LGQRSEAALFLEGDASHTAQARPLGGLTDFLNQRDREIIAFARPVLAVSGTGSSFVAQGADMCVSL